MCMLNPTRKIITAVALTGALVALRVPSTQALTAVLVYRGITFWLAIVIGWPIYWRLSRERQLVAPAPAEAPAKE